jgi:hypothetical protein
MRAAEIAGPGLGATTILSPRTIESVMGGTVTGRNSCNIPGPDHSKADRSLSIRIDPSDSLGFRIHSFAGDGWQVCRDYVAAALSIEGPGHHSSPSPAPSRRSGAVT